MERQNFFYFVFILFLILCLFFYFFIFFFLFWFFWFYFLAFWMAAAKMENLLSHCWPVDFCFLFFVFDHFNEHLLVYSSLFSIRDSEETALSRSYNGVLWYQAASLSRLCWLWMPIIIRFCKILLLCKVRVRSFKASPGFLRLSELGGAAIKVLALQERQRRT